MKVHDRLGILELKEKKKAIEVFGPTYTWFYYFLL
jgi:hypothetical protein